MKRIFTLAFLVLWSLPLQAQQPFDPTLAAVRIKSHGASATIIATTEGRSWILGCAHMLTDGNGNPLMAPPSYIEPGHARDSQVIKILNPPQRFPTANTAVRYQTGAVHPLDVGGTELTIDEYYRITLNIDMGGQFFFRENRPAGGI